MQVVISSHNVTGISSEGFDQYLQRELNKKVFKYLKKYAVNAHILFDKVKGGYNCTLILSQKEKKHYELKVNEVAFCRYDSFNFALEKLVSRMMKLKGRILLKRKSFR